MNTGLPRPNRIQPNAGIVLRRATVPGAANGAIQSPRGSVKLHCLKQQMRGLPAIKRFLHE